MTKRPVRFGVQLWPQQASWREMADAAQNVDRLGFDSLWVWDHFYAHVGPSSGDNFEAWTVISGLASLTSTVRLGVLVSSATFRHPVLVAKQVSTLDHVSSGRAALGLGAGWFEPEHQELGFPFGSASERLLRLKETAQITRSLLAGEVVDFAGTFYSLQGATIHPLPIQPQLPIVIGGGGESVTLPIVARHADVWNFYGTPAVLRHKNSVLDYQCERIGRDPASLMRSVCLPIIVRSDPALAEQQLAVVADRNRVGRQELTQEAGEMIGGPPDQVAEQISEYLELGFSEVIVMAPAPYDLETFERLALDVLPLLRASKPDVRA